MSLFFVSNAYSQIGPYSFITAVKAGMVATALQAIQRLGALAQATPSNDSPTKEHNAEFWQKQYTSRVAALTEMNRNNGVAWIWPKTEEDWDRVHRINTKTEESSLGCDILSGASALSYVPGDPSDIYSAIPALIGEISKGLHKEYCQFKGPLSKYRQALLDCKSSSSGLAQCIVADPQKRTAALEVLAATMKTVLPQNAEESTYLPIKDCFSSESCPDIDQEKVSEREKKAAETAYTAKPFKNKREKLKSWFASSFVSPEWQDVQEVLRFRSDDPREKFLFASVIKDTNGSALEPWLIAGMLSKLSQKFDLKYQVFRSYKDMCKAIEEGSKVGNLAYVLIQGHGSPNGIVFDAENVFIDGEEYWDVKDKLSENTDLTRCFSGINPSGKILLMSCSTGGMKNVGTKEEPMKSGLPFDNIAQKIANTAKRVVVAPRDLAHPGLTSFLSNDDGVLYEPESILYSFLPFYNSNLYSSFRPVFKKCFPELKIEKIHQRELSALDVIKTNLISRSLLHKDEPPARANEYLQICSDDPRKKVLFFVAAYDKNGAMEPKMIPDILGLFADRFDLQYKVVKSPFEICQSIDAAAKAGSIATVMILSHGNTTDGMLLSKDASGKEILLNTSKNCFSKIEKEGTIVLMGSSLGQKGDDKNNIAQKIANKAQRIVFAATCPIIPADIKVRSLNPLMVEHAKYSALYNFFSMGCPENNENHFKTFHPVAPGKDTQPKEEV